MPVEEDTRTILTLSPSAAHRWCACPGSQFIVSQLPRLPSTPAAEEGTLAHTVAAWMLANTLRELNGAEPINGMPPAPEEALATDEMLSAAQIYADAVVGKLFEAFGEALTDSRHTAYAVEYPVEYPGEDSCELANIPEVSLRGRLDFTAFHDGTLVVVDFKYGGSHVPVKDNPQLIAYAACLARKAPKWPSRVIIGIVQPRSEASDFAELGAAMWYEYDGEAFGQVSLELLCHARYACTANELTPREPGEHCKYCPARSVCRAAVGEKLLLADIAAGEAQMSKDATNEQIGAWLTALRDIETIRDDLTRIAKLRIDAGQTVPGWRTQTRRSRVWSKDIRELSDVDAQAECLGKSLGIEPEQLVTKSLRTPAQLAKTLPKDALAGVTEETAALALVSTEGKR